jgi:hypothetical protein
MSGEEVLPAINSQMIQTAVAQAFNVSPDIKMSPSDWTRKKVLEGLVEQYEFVYVDAARSVYFRNKPDDVTAEEAFHKLTDIKANQIIVKTCHKLYPFKIMAPRTISELSDTIALYADCHIDRLNDNIIKVGKDMYWDEERAEFTTAPNGTCMRELFDASPLDEIKLDINKIITPYTRGIYRKTLEHLEANNGNIMPWELLEGSPKKQKELGCDLLRLDSLSLAPFWTWANEDLDTFNDLLKAAASIFMHNKPKGAFILIGRTRNGKSSYIKMLHTMLGRNNTSAVKLADLEDPHFVHDLTTTMLNAPDEDDEGKGKELARSQSYFKSISAHEPIPLKLLFSAEPVKVSTQFMSFYPMNKLPEWSGSGKEACMRRSLILMFNNDLSKFDNNGRNFEKETYTEDFYGELIGVLGAIAHYYREKPLEFSTTMQANRESVSEAIDSATNYLNAFVKYFSGYQVTPLIEDYKLWCSEQGISWDVKDMKQKLLTANSQKSTVYMEGSIVAAYKFPGMNDSKLPIFLPQYLVPEFKRYVSDITNTATVGVGPNKRPARSVIAMLDEFYAGEKKELPEQMQFDGGVEDGSIEDLINE